MNLDAAKFLEDITGRYARLYAEAVQDMVITMTLGDKSGLFEARERLIDTKIETMGTAAVMGALTVLQGAAGVFSQEFRRRGLGPIASRWTDEAGNTGAQVANGYFLGTMLTFAAAPTQTILPRVTFKEALRDMVGRVPTTIRDAAQRTAANIAKLYGEASGGIPRIAFVRSAEQAVTERVQSLIGQAMKQGIPELDFVHQGVLQPGAGSKMVDAVNSIRTETAAWSDGYARMAFRTNVNTAISAGRFKQAQDPDIKAVIPCFRFDSVGDSDTRDNHDAGDGVIMLTTNPAWGTRSSPLGYNCRCQESLVGLPELRRMGRVRTEPTAGFSRVHDALFIREDRPPRGWFPDPGFRHGGRPDLPSAV